MTDATIPNTIIGPAIVNIFEQTPKTIPSLLYSIAGETIEFANPVIGTIEPPPAKCPILSYKPRAVSNAPIKIIIIDVDVPSISFGISGTIAFMMSLIACPTQQIKPPTKNAGINVIACFDFGAVCLTSFKYFSFSKTHLFVCLQLCP